MMIKDIFDKLIDECELIVDEGVSYEINYLLKEEEMIEKFQTKIFDNTYL